MNIVFKGVPKAGTYLLTYQETDKGETVVTLTGDKKVYLGEVRDFVPKYRPLMKRIGDELSDAVDCIDTAIDEWTRYLWRKYARVKHRKRLFKGRRPRK